jgi:AcrR family transcriptional regulator
MVSRRMSFDQRRERLLVIGLELLGRRRNGELSIEEIAETAEISKGLLYHYFPTKDHFLLAVLERGQDQLVGALTPDRRLPPAERFESSLDTYFGYLERHPHNAIARSRFGGKQPALAAVLGEGRRRQLELLCRGLSECDRSCPAVEPTPVLEAALLGWLAFCEGVVLRWSVTGGFEQDELRSMLRSALDGALVAAAASDTP